MLINLFFDFVNTFAKKYKLQLALLIFLSSAAAGFEFIGLSLVYVFALLASGQKTAVLQNFIDFGAQPKAVLAAGLLVALTYILKDLFMIGFTKFQNLTLSAMTGEVFKTIYKKLMSDNYYHTQQIALFDKLRMLEESINTIVWNFIGKALVLCTNVIAAGAILFYLFYKFKINALILSIFILIIWTLENVYFKNQAKKYGKLNLNSKREKMGFVTSTLNAAKEVIIYGKEKSFTGVATKLHNTNIKYVEKIMTNETMPTYFTEIGIMSAFALFIVILLFTSTNCAQIMASLAAIAAVILRIVPTINRTQSAMYCLNGYKEELKWLLKMFNSIPDATQECSENIPFCNSIVLKNVDFTYQNNFCALKNISLEIKKGEFIGILGASGSGKTTLFNIICGLYTPGGGQLVIDGRIINQNNKRAWQNNISILTQDYVLPFDTVAQNVTLDYFFETKDINNALKNAGISEEIKSIDENVCEFSSGQKHRIALARALFFDRDIIMLDEATSSLDVETEYKITKSIAQIKGKKTIIAIAHRLKTLKECDRLIYMDEGKIIDTGSFDELEEKYSSFKRLVELSKF